MAEPLFVHLKRIANRMAQAAHLLVMLDYDGTLTPIVDRPEDAHLDPLTRTAIAHLVRRPHTSVAIISGRELDDVRRRVGIEDLIFAGNHGLEIEGRGFHFVHALPGPVQGKLKGLAIELADRFRHIPGVLVENKHLTLSIHYRLVPEDKREVFRHAMSKVFGNLSSYFHVTAGLMVHEIRPRLDWNKGSASLWIKDRLALTDTLPVYIGDDQTDEDAFLALDDGITVKVGNSPYTVAEYRVSGPADVHRFLQWLTEGSPQLTGSTGRADLSANTVRVI